MYIPYIMKNNLKEPINVHLITNLRDYENNLKPLDLHIKYQCASLLKGNIKQSIYIHLNYLPPSLLKEFTK